MLGGGHLGLWLALAREAGWGHTLLLAGLALLEEAGARASRAHRRIYRPWGSYDGVVEGEHWVVVKGTAVMDKDGAEELVGENQSTYIPLGARQTSAPAAPGCLHWGVHTIGVALWRLCPAVCS